MYLHEFRWISWTLGGKGLAACGGLCQQSPAPPNKKSPGPGGLDGEGLAACGSLWQRSPAPPSKKSSGPGGLDPGVLEAWRLGDVPLEAWRLA